MELQKTFIKAYADQLKDQITDNLEQYSNSDFTYDTSKVVSIRQMEQPNGLVYKMSAKDDFEAAKALYEAYPNLSPLQASQSTFWIYLAHADLFHYVQERWSKIKDISIDASTREKIVLEHWFGTQGSIRQALSGLWWSVYCTIDPNSSDQYECTKFVFSNETFRTRRLGPSRLFRHREGVIGIIKYLIDTKDNEDSNNTMEDRINYVTSYFNKMGAIKQLVYLDRNFFYNELKSVNYEIMHYQHKNNKEVNEM
jgi:hypothetical protein